MNRACDGDPRKVPKPPTLTLSHFSVSPSSVYRIEGTMNNFPTTSIEDTGTAETLLLADLWEKANQPGAMLDP